MKHGPNALIDENLPVVMLATRDESDPDSMTRYEKSVSNIQEVKARDGIVISVVSENDQLAREASDYVIIIATHHGNVCAPLGSDSLAALGLPQRRAPRLRRGPAAQPCQVRYGRVDVARASACVIFNPNLDTTIVGPPPEATTRAH